jgi:hypothetical protein
MKPLQRHAKAPITHDSYSSGRTITLPSGQHLSKGCYPKRTGLYPCNPEPPVFLSDKVISTIAHLINWLSQSHMENHLGKQCNHSSTSAECKTDRSAVLTVKSGLDPHMIIELKDEFNLHSG